MFGGGVTAQAVMEMADVMVEKGLDKDEVYGKHEEVVRCKDSLKVTCCMRIRA